MWYLASIFYLASPGAYRASALVGSIIPDLEIPRSLALKCNYNTRSSWGSSLCLFTNWYTFSLGELSWNLPPQCLQWIAEVRILASPLSSC